MSEFPKTIKAASAISKDKKHLAEAIWLEIPPRENGRPKKGTPMIETLLETMAEELAESGHDYSVGTLDKYRRVALWVHSEKGDHGVPLSTWCDVSWHAHQEACLGGMSFPTFQQAVANGKLKGVDDVRRMLGKSPTRRNDPDEVKDDIRDRIMNDPEIADVAMTALRDRMEQDLTFDVPPELPSDIRTNETTSHRMVESAHSLSRSISSFAVQLESYSMGDDQLADAAIAESLNELEDLQAKIRTFMGVLL